MSSDTDADIERLLLQISQHSPWEECSIWETEEQYWLWIKGQLRKIWSNYPVRVEYKNSLRKRLPVLDSEGNPVIIKSGKNKGKPKTRFEITCAQCGISKPQSQIEIDHLHTVGGCKTGLEACIVLYRLLCSKEHLRPMCKDPCHAINTYAERYNLTFEEAAIEKKIIAKTNQKTDEQKEELLSLGFSEYDVTNAEKRKDCYRKHYTE